MKIQFYALLATAAVAPLARAADPLPKRPDFNQYQAMLARSPFAVATAQAMPAPTPDFAKDLYLANAGKAGNDIFISIASSTDKNIKEYVFSSAGPNEHGYAISNIEWSDRPGATKVTITKDGKYATLNFNESLLAQPLAHPLPLPNQAPVIPNLPQAFIKPAPIPVLPQPQPNATQAPQNRTHVRGMIPRNPNAATPAQDN